ncbi:MAG: adenylosuccinate lyase, partial [Oscillospiraceae bacterium]|nr:adenylosuccinate lyase [Oscillospiraceae bacterium]
ARVKRGEENDLLDRLAACPDFGLDRGELEALLEPERYIGRSPEQVDAYLRELAPVLASAEDSPEAEISV